MIKVMMELMMRSMDHHSQHHHDTGHWHVIEYVEQKTSTTSYILAHLTRSPTCVGTVNTITGKVSETSKASAPEKCTLYSIRLLL